MKYLLRISIFFFSYQDNCLLGSFVILTIWFAVEYCHLGENGFTIQLAQVEKYLTFTYVKNISTWTKLIINCTIIFKGRLFPKSTPAVVVLICWFTYQCYVCISELWRKTFKRKRKFATTQWTFSTFYFFPVFPQCSC